MRAFLVHVCGRLRETTDQLESIALYRLEARIARLILGLAREVAAESLVADRYDFLELVDQAVKAKGKRIIDLSGYADLRNTPAAEYEGICW